jgi:hypothetical protein
MYVLLFLIVAGKIHFHMWYGRSENLKIKIHKIIIYLLFYMGVKLDLSQKGRLRIFENRVLRRIFRFKRMEVTGVWRKLQNVELHNCYFLPNVLE